MADARRRHEYWAGLTAILIALVVVVAEAWPVPGDGLDGDSVAASVLNDRALIGILRLAIVVAALYFVASVPALVVGGRWAKGAGTTGILADDARAEADVALQQARDEVAALEERNTALDKKLSELWDLVDIETRPL